jgi:hypothetical protein
MCPYQFVIFNNISANRRLIFIDIKNTLKILRSPKVQGTLLNRWKDFDDEQLEVTLQSVLLKVTNALEPQTH